MSLIKSLIQRLLDSRTTPAEAGHSAMPSPTEVSLTPSATSQEVWGDVCTGIASSDGYIRMNFSATSPEAIGSARSFGAVAFSTPQVTGDIVSVICPVAKGRAYAMSVRNANNITCAFVKLIGSIGGGYNHFVRRALSCLRALSSSLRRSSFRTNPNGSAIKLCQTIQPSGLFTHLKAHPVNTSHRLTGMSLFTPVAMNGRKSGMETEVSSSPQRVLPTSAFKCLSLKVPKLGMSFRTPWPTELKKRPLSLFQQSERNALTGGALC